MMDLVLGENLDSGWTRSKHFNGAIDNAYIIELDHSILFVVRGDWDDGESRNSRAAVVVFDWLDLRQA